MASTSARICRVDCWKLNAFFLTVSCSLTPLTKAQAAPGPDAASRAAPAVPGETHPGISLEPMYAEAVIAYNSRQTEEALRVLDQILKLKPDHLQALELRSLALKAAGKPEESRANYQRLLRAVPAEKSGPYHFELGVLEFNAKRPDAALPHFQAAAKRKFNEAASRFFLGLIAFSQADRSGRLGDAEREFKAVAEGDSAELKPAAHYYLGMIAYRKGQGSAGTFQLVEAKGLAAELPGNAIAQDIAKAVDQALAPYGKSQWFGSFSLTQAYNGNVASIPVSADQPEAVSGKATLQTLLAAGLGRISSPLAPLQWIASYRGTYNINYNPETSKYQFLTHTANLYLTARPLARTQYGMKLEGNLNLSDQGTDPDASGERGYLLRLYSLTGEVGPYLRRTLEGGQLFSVEAMYRPQSYFNSFTGLSGSGGAVRATLFHDRNSTFWNPTFLLGADKTRTDDVAFRNWSLNGGLVDLMRISDRTTVTASLMLSFLQYDESRPQRFDKLVSARLGWARQLRPRWSVVADATYTTNFSSIPERYYFKQPIASVGINYVF